MRAALVLALACAACDSVEDPAVDGAVDGASGEVFGDTSIDTGADTAFDPGAFDTSTGGACKEQGVPCYPTDVCCGSLVCGDRTGAQVCASPFGASP